MTPTELRALAAASQYVHRQRRPDDTTCDIDRLPWPCPAAQLANAVPDLLDRIERLEAALSGVVINADPDDNYEGEFIDYLVPFEAVEQARAALEGSNR